MMVRSWRMLRLSPSMLSIVVVLCCLWACWPGVVGFLSPGAASAWGSDAVADVGLADGDEEDEEADEEEEDVAGPDTKLAGVIASFEELGRGGDVTPARSPLVRVDPVPRLFGNDQDMPALQLAGGGVRVRWTGRLMIQQAGAYVFLTQKNTLDPASFQFHLAGAPVAFGKPVECAAEEIEFIIEGQQERGPFAFDLWWRGPGFADEPIDPRFFSHDAIPEDLPIHDQLLHGQAVQRGAILARTLGCQQCHRDDSGWGTTHLGSLDLQTLLPGPKLDRVAERIRPEALRHYHSPTRPLGTLAHGGGEEKGAAELQRVIADYLATRGRPTVEEPSGDAARGRALYEQLGCQACHAEEDASGSDSRPWDARVSPVRAGTAWADWHTSGLATFLGNPLESRPHGRMPQFMLSAQEKLDLAHYCRGAAEQAPPSKRPSLSDNELRRAWKQLVADPATPLTGATAAQRLEKVALRAMVQRRCLNCHELDVGAQLAVERRPGTLVATLADGAQPQQLELTAPTWQSLSQKEPSSLGGCLDETDPHSPRFALHDNERSDLVAWLRQSGVAASPSAISRLQADLATLNCLRCHEDQGEAAVGLHAGAAEAHGGKYYLPPPLTYAGERVRADRLADWIQRGARDQSLRPWIKARMPGFGVRGEMVAHALGNRDGASITPPESPSETEPLIRKPLAGLSYTRLGQFLVGSKGLACINCHPQHGRLLTGQADPTTRGPDMDSIREHFRPEYFHRWMLNPLRIRPGTKMPQAFLADGSVPLPQLAGMSSDTPMHALWSYLNLGKDAPAPVNEATVLLRPSPGRPVVQRGQVDAGDAMGTVHPPRGLAIGFEAGTLLFDVDRLSPVTSWFGSFVRSSEQPYYGLFWHKDGNDSPDRSGFLPNAVKLRRSDGPDELLPQMPLESDPNQGSRFEGFEIGTDMVRLRYQLSFEDLRIKVTEDVSIQSHAPWQGITRSFTWQGMPAGAQVVFEFPRGETAVALDSSGKLHTLPCEVREAPLLVYHALGRPHVIRAGDAAGATWEVSEPAASDTPRQRYVSVPAQADAPLHMRVDAWRTIAETPAASPWFDSLPALIRQPTRLEETLDRPAAATISSPPAPTPTSETAVVATPVPADVSPGYRLESIPTPFLGCRPSDVTFDADGYLYATAMTEGQVWRTKIPPIDHPEQVRWQLVAAGLDHPIGVQIVDTRTLFVAQKPEVTQLVDHNGDGVTDEYRTLASGWGLSHGWHEYTFGLALDRERHLWLALNTGYFWTNPGYVNPGRFRGSILRVNADTGNLVEVAKGCRVPNGIAAGTGGGVFFTDNQGDWIQSCKLGHVVPGRFYGHPETAEDALPAGEYPSGRSAIWMPYERSRSTSGPVHDDTQGKFGPFADQMLIGDAGYGANPGVMRVALEQVDGEWQGACFRFMDEQPRGCVRMKFGPDGRLYLAALATGLTRLHFTGPTPLALHSMKIRPRGEGFEVQLTKPLASGTKLDPTQFRFRRYHYLYTGNYGSPEADVTAVPVQAAELSEDRRLIRLTLPVETYPLGMVYEMNTGKLVGEDGEVLQHNDAWYTVQRIPQ